MHPPCGHRNRHSGLPEGVVRTPQAPPAATAPLFSPTAPPLRARPTPACDRRRALPGAPDRLLRAPQWVNALGRDQDPRQPASEPPSAKRQHLDPFRPGPLPDRQRIAVMKYHSHHDGSRSANEYASIGAAGGQARPGRSRNHDPSGALLPSRCRRKNHAAEAPEPRARRPRGTPTRSRRRPRRRPRAEPLPLM